MRVLQLSSHAQQGGAARIAWNLFEGYKERGLDSYLVVGKKDSVDPRVLEIDASKRYRKLHNRMRKLIDLKLGVENFNFPATKNIPELLPSPPDLIHAHNLHGNYFDLRVISSLSKRFPTILTLHDTWLLSGHCAYSKDCDRWKTGCGKCPDLTLPPQISRDATDFNWRRKKRIYEQSSFYIASPSRWLLSKVEASMLMPAVIKAKVIHNGVDQAIFKPAERDVIRRKLGLPTASFVILYVVAAHMKTNPYKDYETIETALNILRQQIPQQERIIFLGLGQQGETEINGNLEKRFIPYQQDLGEIASYYQAADVYVHAARADTFPNVILEALACGVPVVATNVGGISEQIIDGKTGYLTPPGDAGAMAHRVYELMIDTDKRKAMSYEAAMDAGKRFTLNRMIEDYLEYYQDAISNFGLTLR